MNTNNINKNAFLYINQVIPQLIEICHPLTYLGINSFRFMRVFKNGSYILLSNGFIDYQTHYLETITNQGSFFIQTAKELSSKELYYLWPKLPPDDKVLKLLYEHNIWNGITIIHRNEDSFDSFSFACNNDCSDSNNFFINHRFELKNFISYFKLRSHNIIDCKDKSKLSIFNEGVNECFFTSKEKKENDKFISFNNLLSEQNNLIKLFNHNTVTLSSREAQCFQFIARGKTAKEMALLLGLSPRTIECYIEKIKLKTGCCYKTGLIELALYNFYDNC